MNIGLIFGILEKGLSLASNKEARKYLDRVIYLKKEWYKEFERPDRSQRHLDQLERDLEILATAFTNIPR